MATSPLQSSSSVPLKKHSSRSKKSKSTNADSSALERRSWEAWGQREECIFFDSLVRNSRNWGAIAADIGTKRSEQVRTYYYRVLRKISRLLQAVHFNFDNRDRINTLIALLAYWEAKCETQFEESTIEFAEAIKDRILRQRQELDTMRSKRHPTPEKLTVQLVPSTEDVALLLIQAGHNPKLQLTLKSKKSMSSIVDHLNSKWIASNGGPICSTPLRLYIPEKLGHPGYGIESTDTTIVTVFHSMNCPTICKLEYNWNPDHARGRPGVLPGHEHQELQSTSDEGSDEHSSDSARSPSASPAATSPNPSTAHSPRAPSVNRLAVPDNVRGSMKGVSEDALDDDALRHGQLARKAAKLNKKATSSSGHSSSLASSNAGITSSRASPTSRQTSKASAAAIASAMSSNVPASPAPTRPSRYSTRSRRSASIISTEVDDVIQEGSYDPMPESKVSATTRMQQTSVVQSTPAPMHLQHQPQQMMHHYQSDQHMMGGGSSVDEDEEGSQLLSTSDLYAGDAGLDSLEPMPSVEYGFGSSGYIDTTYDPEMSVGSTMPPRVTNQAHTMVINNYYHPAGVTAQWDPSAQFYGSSASSVDSYYPPYPSMPPQPSFYMGASHQDLTGSGFYQAPEYSSFRGSFQQGSSASNTPGYYQGYHKTQ